MSEQTFFVPGPLPGLNEVLAAANQRRGKWNAYDDLKRIWGTTIAAILRAQRIQPVPAAYFRFVWIERSRRRDPDNIASAKKFLLDAVVQAGVLPGDGWATVRGWEDAFRVDRAHAGVQVTIIAVPR